MPHILQRAADPRVRRRDDNSRGKVQNVRGDRQLDHTTEYFNRQATSYQTASTRGLWSWLRSRESRAVLALAGRVDGAEVLELGCGAGFYTRALLARGAVHVWAVDRAAEMLRALPRDGVAPARVLANAAAHAAPCARLVVLYSAPTLAGRAFRAFHAGHGVDARLYTREEFDDAARGSGWSIEEWRACGLFGIAARYSRQAA
jgi:SAM-dependent methyltransferase